jgi:AcrR family transcriptional regulator
MARRSDVSTSAIIVAHPGHELRVFHWMERTQPLYCCLTEGSGGAAASRMPSTDAVLARVGSRPGSLYGRYADKEIYRFLLDGRVDVFVDLVDELADALVADGVETVAGDAVEGFNPSHDVCRYLIDGAVALAGRRSGRPIDNRVFVLEGGPDACPAASHDAATWLRLDEAALDRKIDAALQYPELQPEVEAALARFGRGAFAVECLRPAATAIALDAFRTTLPFYERFGEQRVREGRYGEIIRYREHVLPVRLAIETAVHGRAQPA